MKKLTLLLICSFSLIKLNSQHACSTPYLVNSINFSTGLDENNQKLNYYEGDPRWRVVNTPYGNPHPIKSNTIPIIQKPDYQVGIASPALLTTLSKSSRWIGVYDGYYNLNNVKFGNPYEYEFKFEVCISGIYTIKSIINADDELLLCIDKSTVINSTYNSFGFPIPLTHCFQKKIILYLSKGIHTLNAFHRSHSKKASININGSITKLQNSSGLKLNSELTNNNTIYGNFYTDELNGDLNIDPQQDSKLSGSYMGTSGIDDIITLKDITRGFSYQTTIDDYGFYEFNNLPQGDYILSKQHSYGYSPIIPKSMNNLGSSYNIKVNSICAGYRRDFLLGMGRCDKWPVNGKIVVYDGAYNHTGQTGNYIGSLKCGHASSLKFEVGKMYTLEFPYRCKGYLLNSLNVPNFSISSSTINYLGIQDTLNYNYYISFTPQTSDIGINHFEIQTSCFNLPCQNCVVYFEVFNPMPSSRDNHLSQSNLNELNKINSLNIYPNPSSNFVTVETNFNQESESNLIITDLLGKVMYENINKDKSLQFTDKIDVSGFAAGTYLIYVNGKANKFIKQ